MGDESVLFELFSKIRPQEVYNLAAFSHVHSSFQMPLLTGNITGLGFLRVLEAIRKSGLEKQTRVYSAISSECFGQVQEIPQKETTPFLSSIALCGCQTICVLDWKKLSRELWHVCNQWNSF